MEMSSTQPSIRDGGAQLNVAARERVQDQPAQRGSCQGNRRGHPCLSTELHQPAHSGMKTRPNRVKTREFLPVMGDARVHLRAHPRYVYHPQKVSLAMKPLCYKTSRQREAKQIGMPSAKQVSCQAGKPHWPRANNKTCMHDN